MTGGAAPSTAAQVQASAPAAALSFGRAASARDFEAIASHAPQVARVQAVYGWNAQARRAMTEVYVDGGVGAIAAVQRVLAQASDPNVPFAVLPATLIPLSLALVVVYDPSYDAPTLTTAVISAVTDPNAGPFAPSQLRIGDPLYDSRLVAACMSVAGVLSIRGMAITNKTSAQVLGGVVHGLEVGQLFTVAPGDVTPTLEAGNV
jgi:hypothetical protein